MVAIIRVDRQAACDSTTRLKSFFPNHHDADTVIHCMQAPCALHLPPGDVNEPQSIPGLHRGLIVGAMEGMSDTRSSHRDSW